MSDLDFWDDYGPEEEDFEPIPDYGINDPAYFLSEDARALLASLGIEDAREVIIDLSNVENPEDIRGIRFTSFEDALNFLISIGVLAFSDVVPLDDGLFGVLVGDSK